jgi:hypothetical protein
MCRHNHGILNKKNGHPVTFGTQLAGQVQRGADVGGLLITSALDKKVTVQYRYLPAPRFPSSAFGTSNGR